MSFPRKKIHKGEASPHVYDKTERKLYEQLCRGEQEPPIELRSQLVCRYATNGHRSAFLRLAPLKLEEAYRQPDIVIYHDVMSDREIELIKHYARPRFRRATVQNYKTGELEFANYRISKSAWLKDTEHEVIRTVSQRVEDMTGLTMATAEELQVVNYGIGGHYEPHFDFARREERNAFKSLGTGNRIATVLFYVSCFSFSWFPASSTEAHFLTFFLSFMARFWVQMSDVTQGGATVFPSLNLALRPRKGTAAFWHNLHPSGNGDYATRHAACPVLTGTKWGTPIATHAPRKPMGTDFDSSFCSFQQVDPRARPGVPATVRSAAGPSGGSVLIALTMSRPTESSLIS